MALKSCRECGAQVSSSAEVCPHCGVRNPAASHPILAEPAEKSQSKGCLKPILVIFLILAGLAALGSLSENSNKTSSTASACSSDWTKCVDNAELVNNYSNWTHVQAACQIAAEDRAKFGTPKWPWFSFGSFYPGKNYVTTGIVIAIEKDAQFQNGFGAMVHSRVVCTFDLRADHVIDVSISQR